MRLSIEGQQVDLAPHLLEGIAERLQRLAFLYGMPFEAKITLVKHEFSLPHQYEVQVLLTLIGGPLYTAQQGTVLDMTVEGALQEIARQLA
jgi:ribosome-associated translation inhibitor RaiA